MNLADPARRVSPATCEMSVAAKAIENDDEYIVEPAVESSDNLAATVAPAAKVEPAVTVDDARKFAPEEMLKENYRSVVRYIFSASSLSTILFSSILPP